MVGSRFIKFLLLSCWVLCWFWHKNTHLGIWVHSQKKFCYVPSECLKNKINRLKKVTYGNTVYFKLFSFNGISTYFIRSLNLKICRHERVSKSFRTGRLERELQMVQLSATRCSCIAILWVSLMSFAAITLCVASQQVFIVVVYFVIDLTRKLLDTPSY
jgi:hypothetical protein